MQASHTRGRQAASDRTADGKRVPSGSGHPISRIHSHHLKDTAMTDLDLAPSPTAGTPLAPGDTGAACTPADPAARQGPPAGELRLGPGPSGLGTQRRPAPDRRGQRVRPERRGRRRHLRRPARPERLDPASGARRHDRPQRHRPAAHRRAPGPRSTSTSGGPRRRGGEVGHPPRRAGPTGLTALAGSSPTPASSASPSAAGSLVQPCSRADRAQRRRLRDRRCSGRPATDLAGQRPGPVLGDVRRRRRLRCRRSPSSSCWTTSVR